MALYDTNEEQQIGETQHFPRQPGQGRVGGCPVDLRHRVAVARPEPAELFEPPRHTGSAMTGRVASLASSAK